MKLVKHHHDNDTDDDGDNVDDDDNDNDNGFSLTRVPTWHYSNSCYRWTALREIGLFGR